MGLKGRLEAEVELRSAGDKFYEAFVYKPNDLPKSSPLLQSVDLHEGEFGKPGSTVHWTYIVGGKTYIAKDRIESVDDANKRVIYRVLEGEIMNDYKDFIFNIQVIPKCGGYDLVKWTLDFTKNHEQTPDPTYMRDLVINISKDVDNKHRELQAYTQ